MTNRYYLIHEGISDAYAEVFAVPWMRITLPDLKTEIDQALPKRWDSKIGPLLRTCARAYAVAAMTSDPEHYRKDVLI